jgi:hypothetical protein
MDGGAGPAMDTGPHFSFGLAGPQRLSLLFGNDNNDIISEPVTMARASIRT